MGIDLKLPSSGEGIGLRLFDIAIGGFAEFVGICLFVYLSTGAATSSFTVNGGFMTPARVTEIALTFGFSLAACIYAVAPYSGGHLNPAVTFGLMLTRNVGIIRGCVYIVCQFVGAILASGLLYGSVGSDVADDTDLGANTLSDGVDVGQGVLIEIVTTFTLVFVVLNVCKVRSDPDDKSFNQKRFGPLIIGLVVAAIHLYSIPFTGTGINPARTFGPAVVSNTWDDAWVYYVGPFSGAVFAAVFHAILAMSVKHTGLKDRREKKAEAAEDEGL